MHFSGIVDRVGNDSSKQNENFQLRLKKLANLHAQLLNHALQTYPKLKRLVFSTCSANAEENEAVIDEVLSINGKFKLLDCSKIIKGWKNKGVPGYDCSDMCINAIPSTDCTNGFFIAVFVPRKSEQFIVDAVDDTKEKTMDCEIVDDNINAKTKKSKRKSEQNIKIPLESEVSKAQKRRIRKLKLEKILNKSPSLKE